MTTKILAGCALFMAFSLGALAQVVRIPDANFKKAIIDQGVDTNGDGQIQVEEAKKVTILYVVKAGIVSLEGIKSFVNLVDFGFHENKVKTVDVSGLKKLKFIYGFDNELESVITKGCDSLVNISCHKNKLRSIEIAHLKKLVILSLGWNQFTRLDVSNMTELKQVELHDNQLREVKFNNCPEMIDFWASRNQIAHHLDFTAMPKLQFLRIEDNPIPSLDIRGLANLTTCRCYNSNIKTLNLSGTVKLEDLSWY
ncbi:hypothetical protein D3H65_06655 [Paraflavitalea soli]|uniref:Leucine-rich repeat domain-containing protein n=1 Tax=Paraflavitalea soli TaxID=2315862 RepID=A0A3B7MQ21_9BACT|nr:hypothetical protein [Paraflavitalea soli]AXY73675.1 hypothetical protein D3H65_06655 [Paraflavitalea soli]